MWSVVFILIARFVSKQFTWSTTCEIGTRQNKLEILQYLPQTSLLPRFPKLLLNLNQIMNKKNIYERTVTENSKL